MSTLLDEDDDQVAAEYVLGVTDLSQRMAAEARAKTDPAFAARITYWQQQLSGLDVEFAEMPAPNLMPAIEARLFPQAPKRRWGLTFLRVAPVFAMALVAGFFFLVPAKPDFTATLAAQEGDVSYQVALNDGSLTVTRVSGAAPDATHAHELWLIKGSDAPVSLGVIPANGEVIAVPDAGEGIILAVSLEPVGGSPTGQPTGPILSLGPLQKTS
jgi:anti-sigma-K factor RskA